MMGLWKQQGWGVRVRPSAVLPEATLNPSPQPLPDPFPLEALGSLTCSQLEARGPTLFLVCPGGEGLGTRGLLEASLPAWEPWLALAHSVCAPLA